jgi:hypothetical protein
MRHFITRSICAPAIVTAWTILALWSSSAAAYQSIASTRTLRGGMLASASQHEFEAFFYPTGLRLFVSDAAGRPAALNRLAATVTFYHPNSPAPWFARNLHRGNGSLDLNMNLSSLPSSGVTARFQVKGLEGPGGAEAEFTVPVQFVSMSPGETGQTVTRMSFYGPPASYVSEPSVAPVAAETLNYAAPPLQYAGSPVQTYVPVAPFTYSRHYHIRDWTTGIEKPSYAVSKPWLNVRQYP